MSIKERPLIKAVERLGPLPGWLFSNPIFAGFFAMMMVPVFGAVFFSFWATLGTVEARALFEAARLGAIAATILGTVILLGMIISAFGEPEERTNRLQFVLGGVMALGFLVMMDFLFLDELRLWFDEQGPIAGSSQVHP